MQKFWQEVFTKNDSFCAAEIKNTNEKTTVV